VQALSRMDAVVVRFPGTTALPSLQP
jgi:hypothetical protein